MKYRRFKNNADWPECLFYKAIKGGDILFAFVLDYEIACIEIEKPKSKRVFTPWEKGIKKKTNG